MKKRDPLTCLPARAKEETMLGKNTINETLTLFSENGQVAISRRAGGMVLLEEDELIPLLDALNLLVDNNDDKERADLWKRAAEAEHRQRVKVPVVGTLNANTTPEDFKRYANEP